MHAVIMFIVRYIANKDVNDNDDYVYIYILSLAVECSVVNIVCLTKTS